MPTHNECAQDIAQLFTDGKILVAMSTFSNIDANSKPFVAILVYCEISPRKRLAWCNALQLLATSEPSVDPNPCVDTSYLNR